MTGYNANVCTTISAYFTLKIVRGNEIRRTFAV